MAKRKQQKPKPSVTWAWKEGYPHKVAAPVAAQALDDIRRNNDGTLNAQAVVDESRPEEAPLHPAFEWNDYEAAEAYRRQQAKSLIRAIVRVEGDDKPPQRVYVGITGDTKSATKRDTTVYVTMTEATRDAGMFANAMHRLQQHLNGARASVAELKHAAEAEGVEPERLARIALAVQAIEAASAAVAGLH
jgi:hypothetical protein